MFYRIKRQTATAWYCFRTRDIFKTAPLRCDPRGPAVLVSQLCHRDLAMYLLAVKSLGRYVCPSMVYVLDDTTLTESDKGILRRHIQPVEILPITSVKNPVCPKGGTWERLLFILDLVAASYVIQLDSDTLTLRVPSSVQHHMTHGVSFTLGEWAGQKIVSARESAALVTKEVERGSVHVQMVSEASLHLLTGADRLKYVRGCSGFVGFAKGSFARSAAENFSQQMATIVGEQKWSEWGSEQVTSNFIVANSANAAVLPFPEYCYHGPQVDFMAATFVHFIGSYRFHAGSYARLGRQVIGGLPR